MPGLQLKGVVLSLLPLDLPATIVFYETKLGFARTAAHPDNEVPTWVELSRDGVVFQFYRDPPLVSRIRSSLHLWQTPDELLIRSGH